MSSEKALPSLVTLYQNDYCTHSVKLLIPLLSQIKSLHITCIFIQLLPVKMLVWSSSSKWTTWTLNVVIWYGRCVWFCPLWSLISYICWNHDSNWLITNISLLNRLSIVYTTPLISIKNSYRSGPVESISSGWSGVFFIVIGLFFQYYWAIMGHVKVAINWNWRPCCGRRHGYVWLSTADALFTFNHNWGCFKKENVVLCDMSAV